MRWYCGHCACGPMTIGLETHCFNCARTRDVYSNPPPPPLCRSSYGAAAFGSSAGVVDISSARLTSGNVSPKSVSPTDSRHDVTPEETILSLLESSKHTHRPSEPNLPLEVSVDEAQKNRERDKSTIIADAVLFPKRSYEEWVADEQVYKQWISEEKLYEQCTTDDVLGDISEDTEVSGPSWDPESDLDSLGGSLREPETGDRNSDNPDRSERPRVKPKRGLPVPRVIYMLLVRICGIATRLFEPITLPGKTRIRWICQCGRMLYDDFTEVRPGALANLEQSLNSTGGFYECTSSSSNTTSYASNTRGHTFPGGWLGLLRWPWKTVRVQSPSLPLHERQDALDQVSTQPPADNERRGLCIFMCIPYRRTANKLNPAMVENISTDNALFSSLRSNYKTAREEHISFFSLKTIKSIRFVRFEVYFQGLVDVRTTPDIPDESRRDEYSYHPMPADFIPPIGENHMMHLYTYPEEAGHTGICLGKLPKKIGGLEWLPTHSEGSKIGWGLHFVEGLDVMKLWVSGFIGFVISIMFGVAWSMIRDDMQSGFAVAACMLTGLLFTTGMVQAAYEPK